MKKILVITTKSDTLTVEMVSKVISKDFHFIRFNIDAWDTNTVSIYNNSFELNGQIIDINTIDFIWYRRFSFLESSLIFTTLLKNKQLTNEFAIFIYTEYKQALIGLLKLLENKPSVNQFITFYNSNNKISNLKLASKLGFNTPKTIISNNYEKVKQFCINHSWNIILKTFFNFNYIKTEKKHYIPIVKINYETLDKHKNSIQVSPVFIQEYIEKKYELRIVVIGKNVYPFAIYSQELEESKLDFRIHNLENLRHELVSIPKNIENLLLKYNKINKIDFCSFDIILTPNNEYYFLECNLDGEWYWLEKITGFNLTEKFVDLIYQKTNFEQTT